MENLTAGQKSEKIARRKKTDRISKGHVTHGMFSVASEKLDFTLSKENSSPLYDALPIGYIIVDVNARIKYANLVAAEMLGVERFFLINTNFINFVHKEDQKHLRFNENHLSGLTHSNFDIRIKKKQEFLWARANLYHAENSHCNGEQIRLTLLNINDLKIEKQENIKLKHQLQQTQKMEAIGVLSSGIAHDFNNILHPIICSLELLIEDAASDRKLRKILKNILTGANRAANLVRQILNFNHQAQGEVGSIKLQPIIREVLKLTRSTLPANIKIIRTIDNDCGQVMADPTHIHQIAMNLITNAFHAMEQEGGILDVKLKEIEFTGDIPKDLTLVPGIYACLSVADTGEGINGSIMNKLFDPHFTTKEKGTGLGLSVIANILKKYGGDICFSSEPGKGSLFQVYIPRAFVPSGTIQGSKDKQMDLRGTESILFVDDDPFIVEIQKETFERYGYRVSPFVSSVDALEEFKERTEDFNIVICDMTMPLMTGLELAERIKQIRPDIPIIICTGYSDKIDQNSYQDKGLDGFLIKPAVKEESLKLVRHLLDSR